MSGESGGDAEDCDSDGEKILIRGDDGKMVKTFAHGDGGDPNAASAAAANSDGTKPQKEATNGTVISAVIDRDDAKEVTVVDDEDASMVETLRNCFAICCFTGVSSFFPFTWSVGEPFSWSSVHR